MHLSTSGLACCASQYQPHAGVQVLSAKASANSSPAPALQYAPRAGTGGPSTAPAAKPSNISNALDGIAELQQVNTWPDPMNEQLACTRQQSFGREEALQLHTICLHCGYCAHLRSICRLCCRLICSLHTGSVPLHLARFQQVVDGHALRGNDLTGLWLAGVCHRPTSCRPGQHSPTRSLCSAWGGPLYWH